MKVKDYLPLYGLYKNTYIRTDTGEMALFIEEFHKGASSLLMDYLHNDQNSNIELSDITIDMLDTYDRFSLQDLLEDNYFTQQTIVSFLRELFDNYKDAGGNPMYWIDTTLSNVLDNPGSYKAEIRTAIEKMLIELLDVYSKIEYQKPPKEKQLLSLEDIFSDKNHLKKLVELLESKGFVKIENGSPLWTGIVSDTARGKGLQLVALSEGCRTFYNREVDNKQLWQAWTTYFSENTQYTVWTPGKIAGMSDSYARLFNFIRHSFPIK